MAREDRDVHPKERKPNQIGTRPEERTRLARLFEAGLVDVGRALDPDNNELFTWWAPWRNLRQRNIGWRIDYVLANTELAARAMSAVSRRDYGTSDHAPVVVTFFMSLRTRLIVAFFLLSVVPLAAVTLYAYRSNVEALRVTAEREADLLAGELGQRMQLVTAQLSERVEHLMDVQELEEAKLEAEERTAAKMKITTAPTTPPTVIVAQTLTDTIGQSLGEAAMLLNNVELQGWRPGRGSGQGFPPRPPGPPGQRGGPPPPGQPPPRSAVSPGPPPPPPPPAVGSTAGRAEGASPGRGDRRDGRGSRPPTAPADVAGEKGRGVPTVPATPVVTGVGPVPTPSGTPMAAGGNRTSSAPPLTPPPSTAPGADETDKPKLMIDLAPIRREMFRQIVPEGGRLETMTREQRQRVADEINQRMLGIVQGIQIGAKELQRKAEEAAKAAEAQAKVSEATAATSGAADAAKSGAASSAKSGAANNAKSGMANNATSGAASSARPATAAAPKPGAASTSTSSTSPTSTSATSTSAKMKSSFSGNKIDVRLERDGKVVRQVNAELNLPNVLATVFSTTRGDGGEVPFAVAKDGHIFARSDEDLSKVENLGVVATPQGPATVRLDDWIVVTMPDPSGSGLKLGIARPVGDSLAVLRKTAARNVGLGLLFIAVALVGIVPVSSRLTREPQYAQRGRSPHRAGRLPGARAGERAGHGRDRSARHGVQPDG